MRPAFHLNADDSLELLLYGEIGYGPLSSANVAKVLDANKGAKVIKVRLSSPGGDAFEGITIHNLLAKHPARVEVDIDGQASSAASVIAMAGDVVRIARNSLIMIHQAWGGNARSADEHRSEAEALDALNRNTAEMYAQRSGKSVDEVASLMQSDKWLTAEEAVELGLADEVSDPKAIAAKVAGFFSETRMADDTEKPEEEMSQEGGEETPEDEAMRAEGGADEPDGDEPKMEGDDVSGDSVIDSLAKSIGADRAATIALLTDSLDAVAKILNDKLDRDGSESEEATSAVEDNPEPDAGMSLREKIMLRRVEALEADKAVRAAAAKAAVEAAAEKALDDEVDQRIREGFVLDGERARFRALLKADPENTRAMFSQKRVPAPQAGAEPEADKSKVADGKRLEDLSPFQQRVAVNLKNAGFARGDMKACIAKAEQTQEMN